MTLSSDVKLQRRRRLRDEKSDERSVAKLRLTGAPPRMFRQTERYASISCCSQFDPKLVGSPAPRDVRKKTKMCVCVRQNKAF